MSIPFPSDAAGAAPHDVLRLRKCWPWFLALGLAMILLGFVAIGSQFVATLASVLVFGYLLLAGGVAQTDLPRKG
jgi:uncharacterized membrane protein HdeD (DUF308 family)